MDEESKPNPVLEIKDGGPPRRGDASKILGGFLDVNGTNFMGSGLNFSEWFSSANYLSYERCFTTQTREEKDRRMKYILLLSAEQERIIAKERFATRWSESLISSIIDGDWKSVKMWMEGLRFEEESPELRACAAPNFAKFVEIATEAYETRPKVFCPVCRRPTPTEKIQSWFDGRHECPWCSVVFNDEGEAEEKARANLQALDGGK